MLVTDFYPKWYVNVLTNIKTTDMMVYIYRGIIHEQKGKRNLTE